MGVRENPDRGSKPDRLLTVRELSDWLCLSVRSIYRRIDQGVLPRPIKLGRSTRFVQSDVEACLERLRRGRG